VEEALRSAFPDLELEVRVIKTSGDQTARQPLDQRAGRKGMFTREIEDALRRGEIDVGVHSAKDLPSDAPHGLKICATLPRAAVGDVLLLKEAANFKSLRQGATVATGSVRRRRQLRWKRRDIKVVDLRGNVPTRLRKLFGNAWDAIILARAGLERLGNDLSQHTLNFEGRILHLEHLSHDDFLPAGGQGVIAIQVRRGDRDTAQCVQAVNHAPTLSCLRAEREFLRLLQADCNAPVGVLATMESQIMTLRAQVFDETKQEPKTSEASSSLKEQEPEAIAGTLHAMMYGET
jgi:hydroxymethylbilane synthase